VGKKRRDFKLDEVRERFRLTPTERRVAVFVVVAFSLGLITKCYRDAHSSPIPAQTHSGKTMTSMSANTSKKAYETHAVQPGDRAKRPVKSSEILDLSDSATKQEEQQK
jgi:hypothetical protein